MAEVIWEKSFYPDEGRVEAQAMIVEDSGPEHLAFRYWITERNVVHGGKEVVSCQGQLSEECKEVPGKVRQVLRQNLIQRAKQELEREIRLSTDPFYDMEDREVY
jgi:hypothetical protein